MGIVASDAAYGEVFGAEHFLELLVMAYETIAGVDFGHVTTNVAMSTKLGGAVDNHSNAIRIFGMAAAGAMATAFVGRVGAEAANVTEMVLFPEDGRVSGSRSLVASDAFGIAGFNQVFTAQYRHNGSSLSAYVARRESAAAAQSTAETVRDFYLEYGGTSLGGPESVAVIDILDTIEIVLHQGRYVIGVHEAPDRETALALAERIRKQLQEIEDDGS